MCEPREESLSFVRANRQWLPRALLGLLLAALLTLEVPPTAHGQASYTGDLRGSVIDEATGASIADAQISVDPLGLILHTDGDGRFSALGITLDEGSAAVTITASKAGYADWQFQDIQLRADDTLILNIKLGSEPVVMQLPPPRVESPGSYRRAELEAALESFGAEALPGSIPETITVRVYGEPYSPCILNRTGYETQVVNFKEYVKHVLPNEWVYNWPGEALRAGAMAVKMYGWFWIDYPGSWDVRDDVCDQVYNPNFEYESTNKAVDFTWNWLMSRNDSLILPHYLDGSAATCDDLGWSDCIEQWATYHHARGDSPYAKITWDEMLELYYSPIEITPVVPPPLAGSMLRFYGNGWGDIDRVKVPIDPPRPADFDGAFTLEWWMRADPTENHGAACTTGSHEDWTYGNILFDRGVFGPGDLGDYGVSLAADRIALGVNNGSASTTVCGQAVVADNRWHHVAVVRDASGQLSIFVDGRLDIGAPGPSGPIGYRDGRTTSYPNRDPYLVIGAEKFDLGTDHPSYNGFIDEIRLSDVARYSATFSPPGGPFSTDGDTVALYHFDEGRGDLLADSSDAGGGPSDGQRRYGGDPVNGPEWFTSDLTFQTPRIYLPLIHR